MAAEQPEPPQLEAVHEPIALIPVGLKEAALDSPTFRATALHFADNLDAVERWLDGYVKAASKLVAEVAQLESTVNHFLAQSTPPANISEAVLDHDYSLLALRRYGEGAREFWQSTLRGTKRYDTLVIDPIKNFLTSDLRAFKDARRAMDNAQKNFDTIINRYLAQSKTKEPSSLREDAFQVHEARKTYLRTSMDFSVQAPQIRASLDQLIVKIFAEQWKEMRTARESSSTTFNKWSNDMERIRGWSREMENSERAFKRELLTAKRQLEDSAINMTKPSRELDDYSASTVPYIRSGTNGQATVGQDKAEKQGWLFLKSITGKPARSIWSRRWFVLRSGIFGWLIQGLRSGGVEESEKTGVLLCSVRPAFQEERRFCFEVKTSEQSIILQAETQQELTEWISAFETAKRKALENPASNDSVVHSTGADPAFSISPPVAPEFAAKFGDGHVSQGSEEGGLGVPEGQGVVNRASFDVGSARRVMSLERDAEGVREGGGGTRDHAARLMQKLDLHKRNTTPTQLTSAPAPGGIASLISASHNILPVGPGSPPQPTIDGKRNIMMPMSSLAPSTLANPPAATNLSHTAVVVSGERSINLGSADGSSMPPGILANLWGSSNWGYVHRIGDDVRPRKPVSQTNSPPLRALSVSQDDSIVMDGMNEPPKTELGSSPIHRKNLSVGIDTAGRSSTTSEAVADDYPNYYPLPLKAQNAQFRMLFPSVPRNEKLVLVFRATWNPNEQQEFPGRVYVTEHDIYFFSNHLGLVLITSISLGALSEITAAVGRDCDFLYLHLKETNQAEQLRRITVKVFLEPLKLLNRRLNYLVHNADAEEPAQLEDIIKALIRMEVEEPQRSSSIESWEDLVFDEAEPAKGDQATPQRRRERNIKANLRIDGNLYGDTARTGRDIQKFKLPTQPVIYAPQGMQASISRDFNISAKALFHLIFGDKSAVYQLLYVNRWNDTIVQTPWTKLEDGRFTRRFTSHNQRTPMADTQTIDIYNDHLCYVVTNDKQPWRLPYSRFFSLTTKFVITHSAKSRCKLAVYQKMSWRNPPRFAYIRRLVQKQVMDSLEADALDLTNVAMDQVAKLGNHSKTNKAIEIFGNIGQETQAAQIDSSQVPAGTLPAIQSTQLKPVRLHRLIFGDICSRILAVFSMAFDLFVAVGKSTFSLCTAHGILVAFLASSALYNTWHTYRDGMLWYNERSTAKFMAKIGVKPDPYLSKAIYLSDIHDLIAPTGQNDTLSTSGYKTPRSCRTTFGEQLTSSISSATTNAAGARLNRTRSSIARYRHDLLVALRVVNRVERDIVIAEWEEWVRSEGNKCERVETMLRKRRQSLSPDFSAAAAAAPAASATELDAELGADFAEYCNSCRKELANLDDGLSLI